MISKRKIRQQTTLPQAGNLFPFSLEPDLWEQALLVAPYFKTKIK